MTNIIKRKDIAFAFPGQGSQSLGMMESLYNDFSIVRDTYNEANEGLGIDIWQITKSGPIEKLNETINTQPSMLVAGVATHRALMHASSNQIIPACYAGHSLGEYTALVASGSIDFIDAVKLAKNRAIAMQKATPIGVGAMAAILALDINTVSHICEKVTAESFTNKGLKESESGVWVANDNAIGQIVIAGHKSEVEIACEQLKAAGAKKAMILPVSVPSHCPLMQSAADVMLSEFHKINWKAGDAPVINNYDVKSHEGTEALINALVLQLTKPVRWVETVQNMYGNGISTLVEIGPGKVLAGLNKRIEKEMKTFAIYDCETLYSFIEELNQINNEA